MSRSGDVAFSRARDIALSRSRHLARSRSRVIAMMSLALERVHSWQAAMCAIGRGYVLQAGESSAREAKAMTLETE